MAAHQETLASLALRQQIRASHRLVVLDWLERYGAVTALWAIAGGTGAIIIWRILA